MQELRMRTSSDLIPLTRKDDEIPAAGCFHSECY
jgi:hypothetical protein